MLRSVPVLLAMALAALLSGQSDLAQQHADKALEFVQQGNLHAAEDELKSALQLSPNDPALLTSLGGILAMQGELQRANTYLAKAVLLDPQDPAARRNLAVNQWQLGQLKEAHQNLDFALKQNPRDPTAIYLMGMVSEREGAYARAIALLESVSGAAVQHPEILVALASSYQHTGHSRQAVTILRDLLARSVKPDVLLMAGSVALDAGDPALAQSALARIDSSSLAKIGRAGEQTCVRISQTLMKRGDYPAALSLASAAASAFPASSAALEAKGAAQVQLSYFSQAVGSYTAALRLHPSAENERQLALAEWRAGDKEKAAAEFQRAMRQFPRNGQIRQTYGALLLEDASPENPENRVRALTLMKEALEADESLVEARYQLANYELEEGRLEPARAYLSAALKYDPDASRLHYALSRVYRRLGRDAEATAEMERYQKLKAAEQAHP